jgi:hypothetical protein
MINVPHENYNVNPTTADIEPERKKNMPRETVGYDSKK